MSARQSYSQDTKEQKRERKNGKRLFFTFFIFTVLFFAWLFSLPEPIFRHPCSAVVLNDENKLVGARLAADGQWRFPVSDSIPHKFETCLLLFEDKNFHCHPGVNPLSIGRAIIQNVKAGRIVSGGSTISMQVIRLSREKKSRTFAEKIIEMILSTRLEVRYSKEEILQLYASNAPFGGNIVGLQAASWRYFGRDCSELSWAEAATLAVLPNAPALVHPGKNREILLKKRNNLLKKLVENSEIDSLTCELALSEPLLGKPQSLQICAPHLVERVAKTNPNTIVRTTIRAGLQKQTEQTVSFYQQKYAQNQVQNLAAIIIETQTGNVISYCGNAAYNEKNENYVDVIVAPRSTGSILKPFLYNAMLEEGTLLPWVLVPDIPVQIAGYRPENFERKFDGAVPAKEALARSLNIPAVLMLREYGIPKFKDYLQKAGMATLSYSADHYGLSLILGGAEGTLWDIAGIYASMARTLVRYNQGYIYNPSDIHVLSYLKKDTKGTEEISKEQKSPVLFHAAAVWQTMDALKELNRPELPNWRLFSSSRRIAWKTGTSFGNRDAWVVGVTPEYVVGVWVGNADGEGRPGLTGAMYAAPVMFSLFNLLPATGWFEEPQREMTEIEICPQSGFRRGANCPEGKTVSIYRNGLKSRACPYHQIIHLTKDRKFRVSTDCAPVSEMIHERRFVLPPTMEWYYRQHNADYEQLPPYREGCDEKSSAIAMEFIYPKENSQLYIPKEMDGKKGEIIFEVAHRDKDAVLYWHLDEIYLGSTQLFHQKGITARKGTHTLTITDNSGASIYKRFEVLEK
jgi:penicillin-binding protein 1C